MSGKKQELDVSLSCWKGANKPSAKLLEGRVVDVVKYESDLHDSILYRAFGQIGDDHWTYMGYGPFSSVEEFQKCLADLNSSSDSFLYIFLDKTSSLQSPVGFAALQRMDSINGVIELGNINIASHYKKTLFSTESLFILMAYSMDNLGYRRLEWKCDSLNLASRSAALRLGFVYEGEFRNHMVYKDRNRDTSWFSITDLSWPKVEKSIRKWQEGCLENPSYQQSFCLDVNLIDPPS